MQNSDIPSLNILIITPQIPYPPQQGASLRNWHIIRSLAQNHTVSLLSFQEPDQETDPSVIQLLYSTCENATFIPTPDHTIGRRLTHLVTSPYPDMGHRLQSDPFTAALQTLLTDHAFDIVQIEGIELARTIDTIRQHSPHSKIIFDNHNAETALQQRTFLTDIKQPRRWVGAAYSAVQVLKLGRFERWACQTADGVTAVSATDASLLDQLRQRPPRTAPIPNTIDITHYTPPTTDAPLPRHDLVFTGKMDYRPNVDAMIWFTSEIWPKLRQTFPDLTLAIVGQKPHARLKPLADEPGITLTGFVPDVKPYLYGATAVVMPLRMGSGTRLKLLEAMAAHKPIVSTTIGAEGFPITSGKELILADTTADTISLITQLLQSPSQQKHLIQHAAQFVKQYDWHAVAPQFEALYSQLNQLNQ